MSDMTVHAQVLALVKPMADRLLTLQKQHLNISQKTGLASQAELVTQADQESDEYWQRELPQLVEGSWVISEESPVLEPSGDHPYTWVVDPLDGTTNYAHGLTWFGISIALFHQGQPIYALLYFPALGTFVAAEQGQLIFDQPRGISEAVKRAPYVTLAPVAQPIEHGTIIQAIGERLKAPRDFGCCVFQAYLAVIGQVDCAIMYNVAIWDIAATMYVAECAGLTMHYWSPSLTDQLTSTQSETSLAAYQQRTAIGRAEYIDKIKDLPW